MKEPKNQKRGGETISLAALTKVRPVPFGDVRKYYLAAKVGTVVLLALCFHVSVAAIALRTDSCEQLSTALIIMMLLAAIAVIVGHYMRSLLGYGISAAAAFLLILLLQFGNGGAPVSLVSDLPEYGEVFRDGAKSTEFWILLAKVFAVVHLLLTILFIRSTLTVTEEPPLKGMNVQIKRFTDWLDKNNNSLPPGRRATDYWFAAAELFCAMVFWAADPNMTVYDIYSLILLAAGCFLIWWKQTFPGAFLIAASAVIRCTLYQYRLGLSIPTVAAYIGVWIAVLYYSSEALQGARRTASERRHQGLFITEAVFFWVSAGLVVAMIPVHEFLAVFSGDLMLYQKDNLPLFFFLPLLSLLAAVSGRWYAYGMSGISCIWLWWVLRNDNTDLFYFTNMEQHGSVGPDTTACLMTLVKGIRIVSVTVAILAFCLAVIILFTRRSRHGEE